jgi:hypothetical protein
MTLPMKNTPLLDLALLGRDMAKDLSKVKPCLLNDLTHPLIVLSDLQREEIKRILEEVKK